MKIAITWACGFVGSYAVKYFEQEHDIIAFQRQKSEMQDATVYKKWDLRDTYSEDFDCDVFIHAAADTGYEKSKQVMITQNALFNKNVLQLVNHSHCKHFIYISSSSVYQWISGRIDESVEINEKNLVNSYSFSKYMTEKYIKENLRKDIKLTILRPRVIYGIWDRVLEPNILKHQIFGRLILIWNGKNSTSLTDINYFIETIETVMKQQKSSFEIYNISDRKTKKMETIYQELIWKYHLKWAIKIPLVIIKTLYYFNPNKFSYLIDSFWCNKILDTSKYNAIYTSKLD